MGRSLPYAHAQKQREFVCLLPGPFFPIDPAPTGPVGQEDREDGEHGEDGDDNILAGHKAWRRAWDGARSVQQARELEQVG